MTAQASQNQMQRRHLTLQAHELVFEINQDNYVKGLAQHEHLFEAI